MHERLELGHSVLHLGGKLEVLDRHVQGLVANELILIRQQHLDVRLEQRERELVTEFLSKVNLQLALFDSLDVAVLDEQAEGNLGCEPLNLPLDGLVALLDFDAVVNLGRQ